MRHWLHDICWNTFYDPCHCYRGPPISARTFEGSFSAVWVPTIARVGAFFHIFRDLQDSHSFAPLHTQIFVNFSFLFLQFFPPNFIIFCEFWINFTCFRADFDENLSEFHGIEKCFTKFRRNLKFWRIRGEGVAKKVEIISAKSLIFRSWGWPVLFSRGRGHLISPSA